MCGRIPIIAVSASLLEKSKNTYVDVGFDAWILKPISFARLGELMDAIVDRNIREGCLYQPGEWEKGGWFHLGEKGPSEALTAPSEEPPQSNPSTNVEEAAASEDPTAGDESGEIPNEQERLLQEQRKGKGKHVHYDDLGSDSGDPTPKPSPSHEALEDE
jgi:CheY-like chemotaxis protein